MGKEKTPSERFLKKHLGLKSINEFEMALEDIPQSRFDFMAMQIAGVHPKVDLRIQIANTIQSLKTGGRVNQKQAIKRVIKKLLAKIDSDSERLKESDTIYSSLSQFSSGSYLANNAKRALLRENREDRKAIKEMLELLFASEESRTGVKQYANDLLFYDAKIGDEVCVVDEVNCNFEFDSVMDVFFSGDKRKEKYIQLKKSEMIINENDKFILYHRDLAIKLQYVLKKFLVSTDKDWVKKIPMLLRGEYNSPGPAPVIA